MDTTIDDVLAEHEKERYLVAVLDESVEQIHQMCFGWVLLIAKGLHLLILFGGSINKEAHYKLKQ